MVSVYSPPDVKLLEDSHYTLWSCTYQGDSAVKVIDVKAIAAVIAMVPHQPFPDATVGRFFVVEKLD
jgi:hypothetical protein